MLLYEEKIEACISYVVVKESKVTSRIVGFGNEVESFVIVCVLIVSSPFSDKT